MKKLVGWASLGLFLLSIPFANWWLDTYGFRNILPWVGPVPSAVWVVGFAFVARDLGQLAAGRVAAVIAIIIGVGISYHVADSHIATASALAFFWSESTDAVIFTPLANKGARWFALGVFLSVQAASVVDSALFLRLAFHSFDGWWQFSISKMFFATLAVPVAWGIRLALLPRDTSTALAGDGWIPPLHLTETADPVQADA